jgi:hypothetical protein
MIAKQNMTSLYRSMVERDVDRVDVGPCVQHNITRNQQWIIISLSVVLNLYPTSPQVARIFDQSVQGKLTNARPKGQGRDCSKNNVQNLEKQPSTCTEIE